MLLAFALGISLSYLYLYSRSLSLSNAIKEVAFDAWSQINKCSDEEHHSTFSPTQNVLSANMRARRFRIRVHISTFRLFVNAVVDLEFSSSLETIFILQVVRHIFQFTLGIIKTTITRRKNGKMILIRFFFSSLQSLQVGNKPRWPKPRTVKGTRATLHGVARIPWTDRRPLKQRKRQTGATAPQPAVMETPSAYLKALAFQLIYQLQVLNPYGRTSATFITPFLSVIRCKAN